MRFDSGNRLAFADDFIDIFLYQNRLCDEMRATRRQLGGVGGCLGVGVWSVIDSVVVWMRDGENCKQDRNTSKLWTRHSRTETRHSRTEQDNTERRA